VYADAAAWVAGPDRVYRRLARAAVHAIPDDLTGVIALDAGSGTGAASRALRDRGATVVAADLSAAMLNLATGPRVVGDIRRLPVRTDSVGASVACLVLSHVDEPAVALGELARVTRPDGPVVATAFPAGERHPVKEAADRALAAAGYRTPAWYDEVKSTGEVRVGSPRVLLDLAARVGLRRCRVELCAVSLAGLEPAALVAWRLGMAQVAAWVSTMDPPARTRLAARIRAAVPARVPPLALLVLSGRS